MSPKNTGIVVGLYEIVEFTKLTKDSTNLQLYKLHPQHYLQGTDGRTDTLTHKYLVNIQG
jgi:hypothetical protein